MASYDEHLLNLLIPVFEVGLNEEEIENFAQVLSKSKYISQDVLVSINSKRGKERTVTLFDALKQTNKRGLDIVIVNNLQIADKSKVAAVAEHCFNGNEHVLWILEHWNDLQMCEKEVKEIAWTLTPQKLQSKDWLLEFAYYVTMAEQDSKTTQTMIEMLKEKLSSMSESASMLSNFESLMNPSLPDLNSQLSGNFQKEVDDLLFPLLPMLDTCLTPDDIVAVANNMYKSQKLTENAVKEVTAAANFAHGKGKQSGTHQLFHYVQANATSDWKTSFLSGLRESGCSAIHTILSHYFLQPNAHITYLLNNWERLQKKKDVCIRTAKTHSIPVRSGETAISLLEILQSVISSGEEQMARFTTALQKELQKQADFSEDEDPLKSIPQAIKQEYVIIDEQPSLKVVEDKIPPLPSSSDEEEAADYRENVQHFEQSNSDEDMKDVEMREEPAKEETDSAHPEVDHSRRDEEMKDIELSEETAAKKSDLAPVSLHAGDAVHGGAQHKEEVSQTQSDEEMQDVEPSEVPASKKTDLTLATTVRNVDDEPTGHGNSITKLDKPKAGDILPLPWAAHIIKDTDAEMSFQLFTFKINGEAAVTNAEFEPFSLYQAATMKPEIISRIYSLFSGPKHIVTRMSDGSLVLDVLAENQESVQELFVAVITKNILKKLNEIAEDLRAELHLTFTSVDMEDPKEKVVHQSLTDVKTYIERNVEVALEHNLTGFTEILFYCEEKGSSTEASEKPSSAPPSPHWLIHLIKETDVEVSCQLFTFRLKGVAALAVAAGVPISLYKAATMKPEIVSFIHSLFSGSTHVVTRMSGGSLVLDVLAESQESVQALLMGIVTKKLLTKLQDIADAVREELHITFTSVDMDDPREVVVHQSLPDINNYARENIKIALNHNITECDEIVFYGEVKKATTKTVEKHEEAEKPRPLQRKSQEKSRYHSAVKVHLQVPSSKSVPEKINTENDSSSAANNGKQPEVVHSSLEQKKRESLEARQRRDERITQTILKGRKMQFDQQQRKEGAAEKNLTSREKDNKPPLPPPRKHRDQPYAIPKKKTKSKIPAKEPAKQVTSDPLSDAPLERARPTTCWQENNRQAAAAVPQADTSDSFTQQRVIQSASHASQGSFTQQGVMQSSPHTTQPMDHDGLPPTYPHQPIPEAQSQSLPPEEKENNDFLAEKRKRQLEQDKEKSDKKMKDMIDQSKKKKTKQTDRTTANTKPTTYDLRPRSNANKPEGTKQAVPPRKSQNYDIPGLKVVEQRYTASPSLEVIQRLSAQGEYFLEFRGLFEDVDYKLPENASLCVYMVSQKTAYRMSYDPSSSMFSVNMVMKKGFYENLYKYCILHGDEIRFWEQLPNFSEHGGIRNRSLDVHYDQRERGHAIIFDVVSMKAMSKTEYEDMYQNNLSRFLPIDMPIDLNNLETAGVSVYNAYKFYVEWFITADNGVTISQEGYWGSYSKITYWKKKDEILKNYVQSVVDALSKPPGVEFHARRVLCLITFAMAMERKYIKINDDDGKVALCNGFSLHDIDKEHLLQMRVHLFHFIKFLKYEKRDTRISLFYKVFVNLSSVPECILVLPLLKLLQTQNEDTLFDAIHPRMPHEKSWPAMISTFTNAIHRRALQQTAEKMLLLMPSFSWICGMYVQVLDLETVSDLLQSGSKFAVMFDIDTIFNKLLQFWKHVTFATRYENFNENVAVNLLQFLTKNIVAMSENIKTSSKVSEVDVVNAKKWRNASKDLMKYLKKHVLQDELFNIPCVVHTVTLISVVMDYAQTVQETMHIHFVDDFQASLLDSLQFLFVSKLRAEVTDHEILLWNLLCCFSWTDKEFENHWKNVCYIGVRKCIVDIFGRTPKELLTYYSEELEKAKPCELVMNAFTDVVTSVVDENLKGRNFFVNMFTETTGYNKPYLLKVCFHIFERHWKILTSQDPHAVPEHLCLKFLQNWTPASTFLRILCSKESQNFLREEQMNSVHVISSTMNSLLFQLRNGSIYLSSMYMIYHNRKAFLEAYEALKQISDSSSSDFMPLSYKELETLILLRNAERCAFDSTRAAIQDFLDFTNSLEQENINVEPGDLEKKVQMNVVYIPLSDVVECKRYSAGMQLDEFSPHNVTFFPLSIEEKHFIIKLHMIQASQSVVFKNVLQQVAIDNGQPMLNVGNVMQLVWKPGVKKVLAIIGEIDKGTIQLVSIKDIFAKLLERRGMASVRKEVKFLYELQKKSSGHYDEKVLETRIEQMDNYFKLKRNLQTANTLNVIQKRLHLRGNFDALKLPLEMGEKAEDTTLDSITQNMIGITAILAEVTDDQLDVLCQFAEGGMIEWLKQNMKDIGEVKVMSDLAMISAGDTPMEVDRVSCFLSAVMGFSPLIFDLPKDAGLKELLEACKEVWTNVKRDATLLKKWNETNKHLEWLTAVKDFHGSVEKSSLTRAQKINSEGIYKIGGEPETISTVKNSLKLHLKGDKDGKDVVMSLSELHDLQSRLMLIAGEADKGKQDVTRFVDVLSSVEVLTKAYVALKMSGCLLFNRWRAVIRCRNLDNTRSVTVEVYFDDESSAISSSEDVLEELRNLTKVLDDALRQWMSYLNEKRNEHYHLNHFNIHQLIYLCKQLADTEENGFPDQVYTLLSTVCPNVNYDKIVDYLDEATKVDDEAEPMEVSMIREEETSISKIQKKKKVVRKLVQLELTETVAKAAVQSIHSLDIDDCYLWGLENEFDAEKIERLRRKFDEEISFEASGANVNVIQNVVNERSNLTLQEVIMRIQEDMDHDISGSLGVTVKTVCERYFSGTAVTSLNDCVSLEHLGQFLAMLGMSVDKSKLPKRKFPEQFASGKPNLVVCKKVDIWRSIISIYMASPDEVLPSASEVLVCSESTTAEEVKLLLQRAIGTPVDEGERIYCIACADELPFNVAKQTEDAFQQLTQMPYKNEDYRLIILTSSLQHYLTSCFDEHQVDGNFCATEPAMKEYLKKHLCVNNTKIETAAKVDRDQSSTRVVVSESAGMGKSLFVSRCRENLATMFQDMVYWNSSTIRFLENNVDVDDVVNSLLGASNDEVRNSDPHFIHVDVTPSVQGGIHKFLFDLVILREIKNSQGVVWRHRPEHFYALEYTVPLVTGQGLFGNLLDFLPLVTCASPNEVKDFLSNNPDQPPPPDKILMDKTLLMSEMYQRPFQYLVRYAAQKNLDDFAYKKPVVDPLQCLQTLLKFCSIKNPSWSELSHFTKFLNTQLYDCEKSVFCDINLVGADSGLAGFKQFVVRFMIRMSQDFATPSLKVDTDDDDGIMAVDEDNEEKDLFELHQLRRRWETGFHPYLFFNDDRVSMSFVHFNINNQGALCHPKTNEVVENQVMHRNLVAGLKLNHVKLRQDFDMLGRMEKLETLCKVLGVERVFDPDATYELTTDNVLKMLAIHMRFRCGIPVVVMGETGCGKTRMVEFISKLKRAGNENICNMVVVKVHGGITVMDIQEKVQEAVNLAERNKEEGNVETLLFLDEANTTEAIYAIKEVVCDGTVHGKPFVNTGLKIVAACNPYRKHDKEVIESMEKTGLGFRVKAEDVSDKFAGIPMRQLVYRVISLPPSMQPLVWDFGQLNNDTEGIYIKQMVLKVMRDIAEDENLPNLPAEMADVIPNVLSASQVYMRNKRNICSFVSLRDVERTIQSFMWFYKHLEFLGPMIVKDKINQKQAKKDISRPYQALIHALGMCYHATLDDRVKYRQEISRTFAENAKVDISEGDILREIIACQNVFINEIKLEKDIAKNEALRENAFMIVMCSEMRIPLFLVGKPGSSKSLAKTIVTDAMQGRNSRSELFRQLKQIQVISFQCSALSDAVGIEAVFSQCAQLQKKQDLEKYVAVVVLDEIGLAEDSPKMPLKVLHPLLETASTNSRLLVEPHCKVGFVGISNWALDPAKMNRGLFVTRGEPSEDDLRKTAAAIFQSDKDKIHNVNNVIKAVTDAYLEIYQKQKREFFGLRDYYGLLKMMFAMVKEKPRLAFSDVAMAVLRNFSGSSENVSVIFNEHLQSAFQHVYEIHIDVTRLIHENLNSDLESRFLLLLTKQYSAVSLLSKVMGRIEDYQVIFGSSFPHDHDYTEVCRNINRIKVCMETGRGIVLLNLRDLYESLYDALNQHYVTFADQRYIDLGLGGHRVKCRVATGFRLIVIEEKEVVYKEFPIPLINRLEKYVFETNSILTREQINVVNRLKEWLLTFSYVSVKKHQQPSFTEMDAFPGYKDDTPTSALLSSVEHGEDQLEVAERALLQTASLDSVCRLPYSRLNHRAEELRKVYMEEQEHDTLWKLLRKELDDNTSFKIFEITSFSQVLNERDRQELQRLLNLGKNRVMLLTLQQFQTEQEYSGRLDEFFESASSGDNDDANLRDDTDDDDVDDEEDMDASSSAFVLLIQCPQAHLHGNLIACAKYSAMNKVKEFKKNNPNLQASIIIAFLFTMERYAESSERKASFTSFHSPSCSLAYVDELRPGREHIAPVSALWGKTISDVFESTIENLATETRILNLERLINECIPDAMANLKNQSTLQSRNRVRIMDALCFRSQWSKYFFRIFAEQILRLMRSREKNPEQRNWIAEEACSAQSLQEGGSFRNTLWLRLRRVTAVAVAKITSIIDIDNNLDILASVNEENEKCVDLWLQMFASRNFCDFQWSHVGHGTDFLVKSNFTCTFPFMRLVFDYLEKQWMILQERDLLNKRQMFIKKVEGTVVEGFLEQAAEQHATHFIKLFIRDLVHITYKSSTTDSNFEMEFEAIQDCVLALFTALRKREQKIECNAFVEIFVIFKEISSSLQLLADVIAVRSDILKERQRWIEEQSKTTEFIAHKLAFVTLIDTLQAEAPQNIGSLETCEQWKALVSKAKHVADTIVPLSRHDLQHKWKQIVFVEIFLEQLIPTSAVKQKIQNYLRTLAPLARRLWIGASRLNDLGDLKFLNIITRTLQGCTKEIELRLQCSWTNSRCKYCKTDKMVDPVFLPCQHYVCQKCIPLQGGDLTCPGCRTKLPDVGTLHPVKLSIEQKKELESFKAACTSFFLEYLSTFCFPPPQNWTDGNHDPPPDKNITLALEKLVICDKTTKDMSPLLSNFDTNPTARSYILQLLLRCDETLVEDQLNMHFTNMEKVLNDKVILMDIYIRCIQDMLQSSSYIHNEDAGVNAVFARELLAECSDKLTGNFTQMQHLRYSAKLQFIARVAVSCIVMLDKKKIDRLDQYQNMLLLVKEICRMCHDQRFVVMQQFIIKNLCRRYALDSFNILLNDNIYKPLIPVNLIPAEGDGTEDFYLQSDMLVLSGESYTTIKTLLLDVVQEGDFPRVFQQIVHEIQQSADSIIQILLALSVWTVEGDVQLQLRRQTHDFIMGQLQPHLAGRVNQQIFSDIAKGNLKEFACNNITPQMQYKLNELVLMFGVTVLCSDENLLANLVGLITNPNQYESSFMPTMPASNFFMVKQVLQQERSHNTSPKSYLCPNGHIYFIGECTNPVQAGVCPDCKQRIGGQKYGLLQPGNQAGEITEESQAGYKLGKPEKRTPITPERKLSKLSVCVTRVCLHAAMILGSRQGNTIKRMLKIEGQKKEVFSFLLQHMMKDLEDLSKLLGRSIDDTLIIVHQIFHRMRLTKVPAQQQNFNWQSMAAREVWEEEFQRHYLSLIFKDADALINKSQNALIDAGKLAEKPLQRLVFELILDEKLPDGVVEWDCPILWKYRTHIDMQHMRQKLEAVDTAVGGEGAALKEIVSTENLELLKHICHVLTLHSIFIAKYRQKIDMSDADELNLQDFLEEDNYYCEDQVELYCEIWNKVRHLLANCDRYNTPRDYFKEKMSLQSPISMCLPSRRGRGCCALVLAEYLIDKQNNLLHKCRELASPRPTFMIVDASHCTKKHVICINENIDLMPLVLANSQYETTTGEQDRPEHRISYNFGLLEKKVLEKFILRKAEIKRETIPLMQYPQDTGLANDYRTVQDNDTIPQKPLPVKMCQDIDAFVENTMTANVCEAVRTLSLVIQFLAKLGADVDQSLCNYAEKELLLPPEETELIPRSAQICHCLALYERLSWHRSRRLIQNGQNPFENVIDCAKDIEDEEIINKLKEELAAMNIERLQLELNALLMVGPEMDPEWSLGEDVLLNYLDSRYDVDNSWCEKIPSEILYKHAVHVFRLSTEFALNTE